MKNCFIFHRVERRKYDSVGSYCDFRRIHGWATYRMLIHDIIFSNIHFCLIDKNGGLISNGPAGNSLLSHLASMRLSTPEARAARRTNT